MTQTLTIMRGVPGSGKSTKAKALGGFVLSTDDFFMTAEDNPKYLFNPKQLGAAHAWNQNRARDAMTAGIEHVIVDNTNRRVMEFERYMRIPGIKTVEIHRLMGDFGSSKPIPDHTMQIHRIQYEPHPNDMKKFPR